MASKFDFSIAEEKSGNRFDQDKYRRETATLGGMFFSSEATPQDVSTVRAWFYRGCCWTRSVEGFEESTRINIGRNREAIGLTVADVKQLLPILQELVSDAEQVREALAEVLPMTNEEVTDDAD